LPLEFGKVRYALVVEVGETLQFKLRQGFIIELSKNC
jgi:hypothetical protein